jgi:hypothetical protein
VVGGRLVNSKSLGGRLVICRFILDPFEHKLRTGWLFRLSYFRLM